MTPIATFAMPETGSRLREPSAQSARRIKRQVAAEVAATAAAVANVTTMVDVSDATVVHSELSRPHPKALPLLLWVMLPLQPSALLLLPLRARTGPTALLPRVMLPLQPSAIRLLPLRAQTSPTALLLWLFPLLRVMLPLQWSAVLLLLLPAQDGPRSTAVGVAALAAARCTTDVANVATMVVERAATVAGCAPQHY